MSGEPSTTVTTSNGTANEPQHPTKKKKKKKKERDLSDLYHGLVICLILITTAELIMGIGTYYVSTTIGTTRAEWESCSDATTYALAMLIIKILCAVMVAIWITFGNHTLTKIRRWRRILQLSLLTPFPLCFLGCLSYGTETVWQGRPECFTDWQEAAFYLDWSAMILVGGFMTFKMVEVVLVLHNEKPRKKKKKKPLADVAETAEASEPESTEMEEVTV